MYRYSGAVQDNCPALGSRWRPVLAGLISLTLIVLPGALPAAAGGAQFLAKEKAPATWIAFASFIQTDFQGRIRNDDRIKEYFASYSQEQTSQENPANITAKVWVTNDGIVERLQFADVAPKLEVLLRTLLLGINLSVAPPNGMAQPVHIRFRTGQRS